MESPIEVVCSFCAAWSDNAGAAELAAFFAEDAVYLNLPLVRAAGHGHLRGQRRQDQRVAGLFRHEPVHYPPGIRQDSARPWSLAARRSGTPRFRTRGSTTS